MKKNLFTGWKEIFSFTFEQNGKTKSFKRVTIGIAFLFFVIFAAINIITGVVKQKDSEKDNKTKKTSVEVIHIIDNSGFQDIDYLQFKNMKEEYEDLAVKKENQTKSVDEIIKDINDEQRNEFVVNIDKKEESEGKVEFVFTIHLPESSDFTKNNAEDIVDDLVTFFDDEKLIALGVNREQISIINNETMISNAPIEEADETMAEILIKLLVPMICTLFIYMIILLYGQSIGKIVIVEKSSKLMEMLLVSVKPYAIILGKELGMYVLAVMQIILWMGSSVAGFFVGDIVAKELFSKYENPIFFVTNLLKKDGGYAFEPIAIILGIIALLLGFLMYCVLSGLVSSNVTKPEALTNANGVYQMVVVIGFLGAYLLPLMGVNEKITYILRFIPITAAYMVPSDIIIGNMSILSGIISILLMFITTVILIIFTGKIYKKKIF